MLYKSTRDSAVQVSAAQAITQGISKEGGLFVPESLPRLGSADIEAFAALGYVERAAHILRAFLTDFTCAGCGASLQSGRQDVFAGALARPNLRF